MPTPAGSKPGAKATIHAIHPRPYEYFEYDARAQKEKIPLTKVFAEEINKIQELLLKAGKHDYELYDKVLLLAINLRMALNVAPEKKLSMHGAENFRKLITRIENIYDTANHSGKVPDQKEMEEAVRALSAFPLENLKATPEISEKEEKEKQAIVRKLMAENLTSISEAEANKTFNDIYAEDAAIEGKPIQIPTTNQDKIVFLFTMMDKIYTAIKNEDRHQELKEFFKLAKILPALFTFIEKTISENPSLLENDVVKSKVDFMKDYLKVGCKDPSDWTSVNMAMLTYLANLDSLATQFKNLQVEGRKKGEEESRGSKPRQ